LSAIPVYYDARMIADAHSYSPSAGKPRDVIESWKALGIPLAFKRFEPVSRDELALAHSRRYVDDILDGRADNGFGNRLPMVASSLPWTSGAMLAAAREALSNGQVAVAPVAGFHHAQYDSAAGYCTFNGLIVAARVLLAERLVRRVGILDCDMHYGDGTDQIIRFLGLGAVVRHYSAGAEFDQPEQVTRFLGELRDVVHSFTDCDVIVYQAGADPHVDDPLGGWLTNAQLAHRDFLVFDTCRKLGLPVAWNLAGGYQTPLRRVLDIHDATMEMCASAFLGRD
jgi:acetoin utilization deacetylase AcuC-like enzyme